MRTKYLFEKIVVQKYQMRNYHYQYLGANHYCFTNQQGSINVLYEIPSLGSNRLCVKLSVRFGYEWRFILLSNLDFLHKPAEDVLYFQDKQEFCKVSIRLTEQVFFALDHLEEIVGSLIPICLQYYEYLAKDTTRQAISFANANHLELLWSPDNLKWVQMQLQGYLPKFKDVSSRKALFEDNLSQVIPLCAYLGELHCRKANGSWAWVDYFPGKSEQRKYGVLWSQNEGRDPLGAIIEYFNFAPEQSKCEFLKKLFV